MLRQSGLHQMAQPRVSDASPCLALRDFEKSYQSADSVISSVLGFRRLNADIAWPSEFRDFSFL